MYNLSEIEEKTTLEWSTKYLIIGILGETYSDQKVQNRVCAVMSKTLCEEVEYYINNEHVLRMPSFRQLAVKNGDEFEWRAVTEAEAKKWGIEEDPIYYDNVYKNGYDFSNLEMLNLQKKG